MNFFCISASRRPRARWRYLVRKEPNTTASWATGQRRGRQPRAQTRLPFPVPKGHQEQFSSFSSQQGSRQTCQLHANALRQHPEVQLSQFSPGTGAQLLEHNKPQQRRLIFSPLKAGTRGQARPSSAPRHGDSTPCQRDASLTSHRGAIPNPAGLTLLRQDRQLQPWHHGPLTPTSRGWLGEPLPSILGHPGDQSSSRPSLQLVQACSQLQVPFIWIFLIKVRSRNGLTAPLHSWFS